MGDLENVDDGIRREEILPAADRAAGDVLQDLYDRLDLRRLFEGAAVQAVAPLPGVEGLLLAADALRGERGGHDGRGREVLLEAVSLDVGAASVRHDFDVERVDVPADEAVEASDEIAPCLVVGPLRDVLEERVEPLGRLEGELLLRDRVNVDPTAVERPAEIPNVDLRLFLHDCDDRPGRPVELVDRDEPPRGRVRREVEKRRVALPEGHRPALPFCRRLARRGIDESGILRDAEIELRELDPDEVEAFGLRGVVDEVRTGN